MGLARTAVAIDASRAQRRAVRDFIDLTKPRVVAMVLVTTVVGFYLGSVGAPDYTQLLATLIGTGLAAGGTLALNQYLERDADACMERTRRRPLPSGRLRPFDALCFGAALTVIGLGILTLVVNPLSGMVTATTVITYLGLYTPLKRRTALCGVVGALPGALPPVTGWVAAADGFGVGAWVLLRSCSSGSCRTRWRSRSCTSTTTRAPGSGCCRSSTARGAAPSGRS
jgi:protoheme IX farnesyltransferase